MARGMRSSRRMESESSTSGSSNGTNAGRCGVEPVAMSTTSAVTWRGEPSSGVISSVCSSTNARRAVDEVDVVAREVGADALPFVPEHRLLAAHELRHRRRAGERDRQAVHLALAVAGEEERGLAQRLRRERAGVDAGAAERGRLLDDGDALAEVGRLHGALFAGGAAANHDQIVVVHGPEHTSGRPAGERCWCLRRSTAWTARRDRCGASAAARRRTCRSARASRPG